MQYSKNIYSDSEDNILQNHKLQMPLYNVFNLKSWGMKLKKGKEDITFDDVSLLMSQSYGNVFVSQSVTFERHQGKYTFLSQGDRFAIFSNS